MANSESANWCHSSLVWAHNSAHSQSANSERTSERHENNTEHVNQYHPSESSRNGGNLSKCCSPYTRSLVSEASQVEDLANKLTRSSRNDNNEHKLAQTSADHQTSKISKITNMNSNCLRWKWNLLNLIIINTILSQIDENLLLNSIELCASSKLLRTRRNLPNVIFAEGASDYCETESDCGNREKICHENKCICGRDRPIEDQDRCLPKSLLTEQCSLSEQCLGDSLCVDGVCSCANDAISLFNPSTKIYYCHPKRRLNEECVHESQCPTNSYCSESKYGCLCQNGYSPTTVESGGSESLECLEKFCSNSSSCESEFHQCDDSKCKCLATHFDPTTAKCYRFGSTGGKSSDELLDSNSTNVITDDNDNNNFHSILKDLTKNSDRMWLVLIILISSSIILFVLIIMLIRKYSLGYCWTAHKKEYEPNNKTQPKNGYFNKNSINNKSFRQKNGEVDDDDADLVNDKSDGAAFMTPADKDHSYVKVNINDNHQHDTTDSFNGNNHYHHEVTTPLKTSTSTPV